MPKPVVALLAAFLASLALVACGGDSSSDGPTAAETTRSATGETGSTEGGKGKSATKEGQGESRGSKRSPGGSGSSDGSPSPAAKRAAAAVPPLEVSGGGSAKYRTKGGDNSIQEFGAEGSESELQQAAETLHAFYLARAEENWQRACSYLAQTVIRQFEQVTSRSPQLKGEGCPGVLKAFTQPLPPSVVRETTRVDAVSLRVEGQRAFLVYLGMEGKPYGTPMQSEGGTWKLSGVAGVPLS